MKAEKKRTKRNRKWNEEKKQLKRVKRTRNNKVENGRKKERGYAKEQSKETRKKKDAQFVSILIGSLLVWIDKLRRLATYLVVMRLSPATDMYVMYG